MMPCDRERPAGFTLAEMLVVVAIIAVVAGMVVWLAGGARETAEKQTVQAELATIRNACLQFKADMGEPPQYLAELMQSPDGSVDSLGGWWWRTDGTPDVRLRKFDPATRRGWDGPYIKSEARSSSGAEARESRLTTADGYEPANSDDGTGHRLCLLLSDCALGQASEGTRLISHYQLDLTDTDELFVRCVQNPGDAPDKAVVVTRLGLGMKP